MEKLVYSKGNETFDKFNITNTTTVENIQYALNLGIE